MVLGRLRSLQKKLLKPMIGRGGRVAAPLRAYGKLELAPEYVDVGCDDPDVGRQFRAWINDGCKRLEPQFENEPLRLRRHRLLLSLDDGRVWVVACLWNSSDKRSEHGSQRNFPFVLFAIVPAPGKKHRLAVAAAFCCSLWEQMEQVFPSVARARDRGECARLIRQQAVGVDVAREAARADSLVAAERIPLGRWLEAIGAQGGSTDGLFLELQRRLEEFRRSKGRAPLVWRLPLAENLDTLAQLGAWLFWLERSLICRPGEFGLVVPLEPSASPVHFGVVLRRLRLEDFAAVSADPGHVDRALGPCLTRRDDAVREEGPGSPWGGSGTLADFARGRFPQSPRGRG